MLQPFVTRANGNLPRYDQEQKLNGLLYLQRISDPRFSGQSARNLEIFQGICGASAFKNVVVLTTFWDRVSPTEGARREAQLKSQFFKDLVEGGAHFMRHDRAVNSTRAVLRHIFTLAPTITQIQSSIREEGNSLEDTAPGSVLKEETERIIAKHREEVANLKARIRTISKGNEVMRRKLEEERVNLQQELARWDRERSQLKKGLGEAKESREQLEAQLQAQLVAVRGPGDLAEIRAMESPPPYEDWNSGESHYLSVSPAHDTICRVPVRSLGQTPALFETHPPKTSSKRWKHLQL